jgi:hypothetical protein
MRDTLGDFLTARDADPAHLQHSVRYLVAEWSADTTPDQMRSELELAIDDPERLRAALTALETDTVLLDVASLDVLQAAWDDDELHDAATGAVDDAKSLLPVIEVGLTALVTMYGLYLARTGGRRRTERHTIRKADGSYETHETTEYHNPADVLASVVSLFTGRTARDREVPTSSEPQLPSGEPTDA